MVAFVCSLVFAFFLCGIWKFRFLEIWCMHKPFRSCKFHPDPANHLCNYNLRVSESFYMITQYFVRLFFLVGDEEKSQVKDVACSTEKKKKIRYFLFEPPHHYRIKEVRQNPLHTVPSRPYALTSWIVNFLFKKFFYDCLCKVVRRRFGFA